MKIKDTPVLEGKASKRFNLLISKKVEIFKEEIIKIQNLTNKILPKL